MCSRCDYANLLGRSGLHPTPNRLAVLATVGNSPSPLTAQDIYDRISRAGSINRVTVYRILDLLVAHRLVERLTAGDRAFRFGLAPNRNHPEHAHFLCRRCGGMECLSPDSPRVSTVTAQAEPSGIVERVEVRFEGVCRRCLQNQGSGSEDTGSLPPD